jgi:hypothetical protein
MDQQFALDDGNLSVQPSNASDSARVIASNSPPEVFRHRRRHAVLQHSPAWTQSVAPTTDDPTPARQLGHLLSTLIALASLVAVTAVAFGTMLGLTAILEQLYPSRRFDEFHAFHEPIALAVLIAAAVLWVLPPHPWANRPARPRKGSAAISKQKVVAD